jgi:hypothetical protein
MPGLSGMHLPVCTLADPLPNLGCIVAVLPSKRQAKALPGQALSFCGDFGYDQA